MEINVKVNEKAFAREVWLNYFNDYLLKNNFITEQEHKQMATKIIIDVKRHLSKANK